MYGILAALWILSSDDLTRLLAPSAPVHSPAQTLWGLLFVAVTSALLYLVISRIPLARTAEADTSPGGGSRTWILPAAVFIALAMAVAGTGLMFFERQRQMLVDTAHRDLADIAALQAAQIDRWHLDRKAKAEILRSDRYLGQAVADWLQGGIDPPGMQTQRLQERLETLRQLFGSESVVLIDGAGEPRLAAGEESGLPEEDREHIGEALQGRLQLTDLHVHDGETVLELLVPLHGAAPRDPPVAALRLTMSLRRHIDPLLQAARGDAGSTATVLLRREGDQAVYLSPSGQIPAVPLRLDDAASVAAQALGGGQDGLSGTDHRGRAVLAAARPLTQAPWWLLAKEDAGAVVDELQRMGRRLTLVVFLFMVTAGGFIGLWWRQQWLRMQFREADIRLEREVLSQQLNNLARYANDIVVLVDSDGRIVDANDRAMQAYGYGREELLGMEAARAFRPRGSADPMRDWAGLDPASGLLREDVHHTRDGRPFDVELSVRPMDIQGRRLYQAIVRDITERKRAEQRIRQLTRLYDSLRQSNQAIARLHNEEQLFRRICEIAVDLGGLSGAWIGELDPDSRRVRPLAFHGNVSEYIDQLAISADPDDPRAQGPSGQALIHGRPDVSNDVLHDAKAAPWRALHLSGQIAACAAFPIRVGGRVVHNLTLYARDPGFFDQEVVDLLTEMASDIELALENLARERRRREAEEQLQRAQAQLQHIVDINPSAVYFLRIRPDSPLRFDLAYSSRTIERLAGYSLEEWRANRSLWTENLHPEDRDRTLALQAELLASGRFDCEYRFRHRDGHYIWVHDLAVLIRDADGRPTEVVGSWTDITRRKQAEDALHLSAEVFESSRESIIICDPDWRIISVNPAFTDITGFTAEEVLGRTPGFLRSRLHDNGSLAEMQAAIDRDGHWQGEVWNRRKSGDSYPEWVMISVVRDAEGQVTHYIGVGSDITEHKEAQARIHYLAHYDALTDLPNRRLLQERLNQALKAAARSETQAALLFLDLDRFKFINDSLGHHVGDLLLQSVARRLTGAMRGVDTVSRLGGDEFLILLPDTGAEGADQAARRILDALSTPMEVESHRLLITPSIGISVFPADGGDIDTLIKNADAAMYHAKDAGRNTYRFFAAEMNAAAHERLELENRLHQALRRGEFLLHYQPQVALADGRIIGVEALLRWQPQDAAMVPPGRFIPVAEDCGLIVPIGEWVLNEACAQAARWQRAGLPPLPVSINLSALQLRQADLPDQVARALEQAGLDARWLEVELTESILMQDTGTTADNIRCLSEMGLSLAIDDFGTGYSNLGYLKRFPIRRLKVDQSFVQGVIDDADDAAIVRAVVQLGHSLRLRVIAEGVETAAQADYLMTVGCDEAQGYHFGRPDAADRISARLQKAN